MQNAILTLPEKQRLVFTMKYFDEMKYEDMSDILGTSVGALKASYHHAVKKVEEFLTKTFKPFGAKLVKGVLKRKCMEKEQKQSGTF